MYGPVTYANISARSDDRSLRWLYVDLNSFFASVEQELNPKLRGRPVGVIPLEADTTSCIAASYEAKKFGVKTGTMVADARRMCPGIQFVVAAHGPYIEFHHKIQSAIESCIPVSAVCSIDEFAMKLMGKECQLQEAWQLGQKIRQTIYKDVGSQIHCSIGLAPNRYLAKIATDMVKPNGLTALLKSELPGPLKSLKLRDLPGVGPRMEMRLHRQGIYSMEKLLQLDLREVRLLWGGIWGERIWHWLRGGELELADTNKSSVSHSHVLAPEFRNPEKARLVALKLMHKAASRLRRNGLWARHFSLHIRYVGDPTRYNDQVAIPECCDDLTMLESFHKLWDASPQEYNPRKVAIALTGLVEDKAHTYSLFSDPRREQFVRTMDAIQNRYGKAAIQFASLKDLKGVAPPRIAFTNIPNIAEDGDGEEGDEIQ